ARPDLGRLTREPRAFAFEDAGVERAQHAVGRFVEASARRVHLDVEAEVFAAREAPAHSEDRAPAAQMVEHRELLGDAQRIVPRKNDRAGRKTDAARLGREPRQVLEIVGTRRVVAEVMLDDPHRMKPELLRLERHLGLLLPDDFVRIAALIILKNLKYAVVHNPSIKQLRSAPGARACADAPMSEANRSVRACPRPRRASLERIQSSTREFMRSIAVTNSSTISETTRRAGIGVFICPTTWPTKYVASCCAPLPSLCAMRWMRRCASPISMLCSGIGSGCGASASFHASVQALRSMRAGFPVSDFDRSVSADEAARNFSRITGDVSDSFVVSHTEPHHTPSAPSASAAAI